MTDTDSQAAAAAPPLSLAARFVGVLTSPKATFQSVVAHPSWFGMLALCCVTLAIVVGGYLFTSVGQNAWLDMMGSNPSVTDQAYEQMRRIAPYVGWFAVGQMLVATPLITLIVAGILFVVFNAVLAGNATFKQLFAVIVHAAPISVVGQLFTVPLNYARGALTSATNLSVLLPMVDETSFLGRLFGMVDLFIIWWLIVLAIGLGVLYRRRTQPIAWSLFGVYAVIAVIVAIVRSMGGA
jgi:Yip1 domain